MSELALFVAGVKDRYGTLTAIAGALGMSLSAFSRGVTKGTLGVENLLELARETHTPPGRVLRMGGKARVADLIDTLYPVQPTALTPDERAAIETLRALAPDVREALLAAARAMTRASPAVATPAPRRRSRAR